MAKTIFKNPNGYVLFEDNILFEPKSDLIDYIDSENKKVCLHITDFKDVLDFESQCVVRTIKLESFIDSRVNENSSKDMLIPSEDGVDKPFCLTCGEKDNVLISQHQIECYSCKAVHPITQLK